MAEFRLALGAVADVASSEELKDSITGLQGHISKEMSKLRSDKWTWRPLQGSGSFTIQVGLSYQIPLAPSRPAAGKVWSLRRLTIIGSDDSTHLSGLTAAVYSGDAFNMSLGQCIIPGQQIPYFNTFGNNSLPVFSEDNLFVNISSSTFSGAQSFVISAHVQEWDDPAIECQYA